MLKRKHRLAQIFLLSFIFSACFINSARALSIIEYPIPNPTGMPWSITSGPDGALWFIEYLGNQIGRIDPTTHVITEYAIPTPNSGACTGITSGPDGALWFTEGGRGRCSEGPTR